MLAIIATLGIERGKERREFLAIRRALVAEIFQIAIIAFLAHRELKIKMLQPRGLTIHQIEDAARFVNPSIYSNIGSHVGVLGDHTHDVVLFFSRIQAFSNGVARMRRDLAEEAAIKRNAEAALSGSPKTSALMGQASSYLKVGPENSKDLVESLLVIAETGIEALPYLTEGTIDEAGTTRFKKAVQDSRAEWGIVGDRERDHWTTAGQQLLASIILYVYGSDDIPDEKRDLPTVRRILLGGLKPALHAMTKIDVADVLAQGSRAIITDRVAYWDDKSLDGLWDDPRAPTRQAASARRAPTAPTNGQSPPRSGNGQARQPQRIPPSSAGNHRTAYSADDGRT